MSGPLIRLRSFGWSTEKPCQAGRNFRMRPSLPTVVKIAARSFLAISRPTDREEASDQRISG